MSPDTATSSAAYDPATAMSSLPQDEPTPATTTTRAKRASYRGKPKFEGPKDNRVMVEPAGGPICLSLGAAYESSLEFIPTPEQAEAFASAGLTNGGQVFRYLKGVDSDGKPVVDADGKPTGFLGHTQRNGAFIPLDIADCVERASKAAAASAGQIMRSRKYEQTLKDAQKTTDDLAAMLAEDPTLAQA